MITTSADFISNIYAPIRQINAKMHFTMNSVTTTYDDDTIIDISIIEEVSPFNETLPSNEVKVTMDNSGGQFDFLNFQNMAEILANKPLIVIEFGLIIPAVDAIPESEEWIPMGKYYLNSWENNRSTKTVSLIGRDTFGLLNELFYNNTGKVNLYDLAVDVFAQAGVSNYSIHDSLKTITTTGFTEKVGSKEALQHIAIASTCVIYQDRLGVIHIKPFQALDLSSNFMTYTGQAGLYAGALSYPLVSTGSGMRRMDLDNMYDKPKLSLERSINEITMVIYQGVTHEMTYTNPTITGTNGTAFTIDNPLINSDVQASNVAQWIMRESNYNVMYNTDWRGNPALECVDVVLIEEGTNANKQSRIYRQEFFYEGYLTGVTDSRGGI